MATYSGKDYTSFKNVNLRGSGANVPGALRTDANGEEGVATLPIKTGTLPIAGTFVVQLPAVTSTSSAFSTIVTVSGIRAEDGLTFSLQGGTSAGYSTVTTAKVFQSAIPGNGNITLNFINLGASTGYTELIGSYTAFR